MNEATTNATTRDTGALTAYTLTKKKCYTLTKKHCVLCGTAILLMLALMGFKVRVSLKEQYEAAERKPTRTEKGWVHHSDCMHDCTPSNLSWSQITPFADPCTLLKKKRILFVGDSFVRHTFVAFVLWLSGDYAAGALRSMHAKPCEYSGQFEEKLCRHQLQNSINVCGVHAALKYGAWPTISRSDLENNNFIVWGGGNHPVDGNYRNRSGVNDADVVRRKKIEPTCRVLPLGNVSEKVIWLNTHASLNKSTWSDQTLKKRRSYHDEIPAVLLRSCGINMVASVFRATETLVDAHSSDATNMTYDGMHWSLAINLLKAYAVVNVIVDSRHGML